jgi:hypothetical protein
MTALIVILLSNGCCGDSSAISKILFLADTASFLLLA